MKLKYVNDATLAMAGFQTAISERRWEHARELLAQWNEDGLTLRADRRISAWNEALRAAGGRQSQRARPPQADDAAQAAEESAFFETVSKNNGFQESIAEIVCQKELVLWAGSAALQTQLAAIQSEPENVVAGLLKKAKLRLFEDMLFDSVFQDLLAAGALPDPSSREARQVPDSWKVSFEKSNGRMSAEEAFKNGAKALAQLIGAGLFLESERTAMIASIMEKCKIVPPTGNPSAMFETIKIPHGRTVALLLAQTPSAWDHPAAASWIETMEKWSTQSSHQSAAAMKGWISALAPSKAAFEKHQLQKVVSEASAGRAMDSGAKNDADESARAARRL